MYEKMANTIAESSLATQLHVAEEVLQSAWAEVDRLKRLLGIEDGNPLLDYVIQTLCLKNDAALCRLINVGPPLISNIRTRKQNIPASLYIVFSKFTGLSTNELKNIMRRSEPSLKRTLVRPPYPNSRRPQARPLKLPNQLLDYVIKMCGLKNDADLARALGVSPPMLSMFRKGKHEVSATMYVAFHDLTGLSIAELRNIARPNESIPEGGFKQVP